MLYSRTSENILLRGTKTDTGLPSSIRPCRNLYSLFT